MVDQEVREETMLIMNAVPMLQWPVLSHNLEGWCVPDALVGLWFLSCITCHAYILAPW